jgi:hypothetical protein
MHYSGVISYEIEADNPQDADDVADKLFWNETAESIKENVEGYRTSTEEMED